jgi:hypothetical protein
MFGAPFYFSLMRKYVILMGTLLNNIRITRTDSSGNVTALLKVPITYGPKDKMLARVFQDPALDKGTAVGPLPMISFEMGEIKYDGTRKLNTIGKSVVNTAITGSPSKLKYQYNPVPYNISFKAFIYVKNVEDGTKIMEQILPYFTPDWTTTCNLIPEMEITMDIPIILTNINYEDKYDGDYKDRRMIIWSLDFLLKGYFYGPVKKSGIIKFINTNFYIPSVADGKLADAVGNTEIAEKVTIQPGLSNTGVAINWTGGPNTSTGTIPYTEIEADDDYGYITMIYNSDELNE